MPMPLAVSTRSGLEARTAPPRGMGSVAEERTRTTGDVARTGTPMLPAWKMRGGPVGAEPSLMVELESVEADGAPLSCAIEETPLSNGIAIGGGLGGNPLIIGAAMGAAI